MDKYDRTAEAFRYSVKKDALTPTRLDEDFTFALKRFASRMDGALEFLFETHREAEDRLFQEIERASL